MTFGIEWLSQTVPLWVFLLALLTSPHSWAKRIQKRMGPLLDTLLPV